MSSVDPAIEATRNHRSANARRILHEFRELLALPNVSKNLDDVRSVAEHVVAMLTARGIAARAVDRPGAAPLVVGRFDVPGATQTVGFYAHYDGQPIDQEDWRTEPFEPTLTAGPSNVIAWSAIDELIDDDWRIYARSSSDDKAPILAMCHALEALGSAGMEPTTNLVFLFEGEEEIGSPHLAAYLNDLRDELGDVDTWLICDGPVHQSGAAQVVFGVRGISEMEITVYGPSRPLHSGHYGNWVRNPNLELSRLLASMKDAAGNVVIDGFYGDTVAITAEDRLAIAALPDDDSALRKSLGLVSTEVDNAPLAERLLLPSLNIRGLSGGAVGSDSANVIPTQSTASIDIRLAPGNDPETIMDRVVDHIEGQGWHVVTEEPDMPTRLAHERIAKVTRRASYPGVRTPLSSPLSAAVRAAAVRAASGDVAAVPSFGGSVPLHYFTTILNAPVAITPFANHDNNQHAANENIRIGNLWYGIDLMAALMTIGEFPSRSL